MTVGGSLLFVSAAALLCGTDARHGGGQYRLLVLHTNDMHSRFDEIDPSGGQCDDGGGGGCYGGFARLKAAADAERARAADGSLFLNAGDTFQGSPFYTYFKWTVAARMIRNLGIDVMSLGNHEFDDGVKDAQSFIQNIPIPVVACNIDLSDEPLLANEPNLMKSKVLTVNGRKIGIIGYLTSETEYVSNVGKVKFLPEIPSIIAEANHLKNHGINIIIALGHSGFEMDVQIAQEVELVDLVIGGHTHTFLYTGDPPDIEKPVGPYPVRVKQRKTNRTVPVVQASHMTKYLGKLWMEFDEEGEVVNSYGNPILLDSNISQDSEFLIEVNVLKQLIEEKTKQVIGSTSVFLEGDGAYCRQRECNFGNFLADSYVNYNVRKNTELFDLAKYWTDAPIAIVNSGAIRSNINHMNRRGYITLGDLLSTIPFQGDIGKVTVKGSDIWEAFEFSVRRYDGISYNGEFLQVSGLQVVIDLEQPSGKRVQSIKARCRNCVIPVYQELNIIANYTIIMSKYVSEGGDGFAFKNRFTFQSFGKSEVELIEQEIRIKSPIWPKVEQRIILLNPKKPHEAYSHDIPTLLSNINNHQSPPSSEYLILNHNYSAVTKQCMTYPRQNLSVYSTNFHNLIYFVDIVLD